MDKKDISVYSEKEGREIIFSLNPEDASKELLESIGMSNSGQSGDTSSE